MLGLLMRWPTHAGSPLISRLLAGEVHLETCVKDLRERFARIPLHVSAPLVAFRESIFHPEEITTELVVKPAKVQPSVWCIVLARAAHVPQAA